MVMAACVPSLAAGACRRDRLPHRLAGCYALFDRRGKPASDSLYWAPDRMRLETERATPRPYGASARAWRLSKLGPQPDGHGHEILYWARDTLSSDSIHVVFSSGFSGTVLTLPATAPGDTLKGRATEVWDSGPPFETDGGGVTAVRVPCMDGSGAR